MVCENFFPNFEFWAGTRTGQPFDNSVCANFAEHPCLQDIRERSMTRKITIEQKWHQQSEAAKSEAEKPPHGKERDALVRKARQLNTASQINEWLSSSGLKPPD
jgi:hypothetical protein